MWANHRIREKSRGSPQQAVLCDLCVGQALEPFVLKFLVLGATVAVGAESEGSYNEGPTSMTETRLVLGFGVQGLSLEV